jgi:hypothetical protein
MRIVANPIARLTLAAFTITLLLLMTRRLPAQNVEGHPVDNQCNYRDGRGWVTCGDYPRPEPPQPPKEKVEIRDGVWGKTYGSRER